MVKKSCIEEIKALLKKKKTFTSGGIIEKAVSNVSTFKAGTVNRELRAWSEGEDSLLEKSYFPNPEGKSRDCVQYRVRK